MNVQQLIVKGIKQQLFVHNYLVLPGFGGFVLKLNAAHFSTGGAGLVPPSKTVSFNVQLRQNDGVMTLWLQQQLGCTANEALAHLKEFTSFCSGVLNTRRRLTLDGIGFFYLDFENNICFEPQPDSNFLTKSFGLTAIAVKELEPEVQEPKKETVFVDRAVRIEQPEPAVIPNKNKARNYNRLLVPAVLMIVFLSGLLLFVSTAKMGGRLQASLFSGSGATTYSPVNYSSLPLLTLEKDNAAYVADANGIAPLTLDNDKTLAVKVVTSSTEIVRPVAAPVARAIKSSSGKFEIVLGCFTVSQNASRLLSILSAQHVKAFVSGKNEKGMYVVSGGAFENKEAAVAELDQLKAACPKAWIRQN